MLVVGPNQNQFYLLSPKKKKNIKTNNNLSPKICYKYYERNIILIFMVFIFFKGRQDQLVV